MYSGYVLVVYSSKEDYGIYSDECKSTKSAACPSQKLLVDRISATIGGESYSTAVTVIIPVLINKNTCFQYSYCGNKLDLYRYNYSLQT